MSTDFDDLCGRFEALKEQFHRASSDWPGFESVLITWPEDKPEPENLPTDLQGEYAVPVPAPEGELHYVAMLTGSRRHDTPAGRYRKGSAGMLIYRRSFGRFGNPLEITDPDHEQACNDRYKFLAGVGAALLKTCGAKIGLSENTLMWRSRDCWVLALHETLNPEARQLREWRTVETDWHTVQVLKDIFFESVNAITIWLRILFQAKSNEILPIVERFETEEKIPAPSWDNRLCELRYGGQVVRKIRPIAKNPILILTVFNEESWPRRIDNPLKPQDNLSEAIRTLNTGIKTIHFKLDGSGDGILWRANEDNLGSE